MSIDYESMNVVAVIDRYEFNESEHASYAWHARRKLLLALLLIMAVILFALLKFVDRVGPLELVVVMAAFILLMSAVVFAAIRFNVRKGRIQPAGSTGVVTIFEEGVRTNIKDAESWMPWSTFVGYRVLPFGVALHMNSLLGFILPKRVFESDEAWERAVGVIESQLNRMK